jgi:hypothetical protein
VKEIRSRDWRLVVSVGGAFAVPVLLIAACGSPGMPEVTSVPRSIPHDGVALWQDNDQGTLTGLEVYLHPPRSAGLDLPKTQAETLAQEQGSKPGVSVKDATLASLTFPSGIGRRGAHDAWVVTLAYPSREPQFCVGVVPGLGRSVTTTTTVPATGCGMWVSKYIVAVDALSGSVQYLIQTN